MNLEELKKNEQFLNSEGGIGENLIVIIQDRDGDTYIMSEANHEGGICNCCSLWYEDSSITVLKVYNGYTLEVYYENRN